MCNQPIKVLMVDDHATVRKGMKALLEEYDDIYVVGEASDGLKAIELVKSLLPDVILLDGDNGAGLGASHQTGWTGTIATLLDLFGRVSAVDTLLTPKERLQARIVRESVSGRETQ